VADGPRIDDLRRRIQEDPASLAFAPLAEELRRAGRAREAVSVCRSGLAIHPEYLSARATLGRALLDLGQLDDAFVELTAVLAAAPDHLSALKGVAEIRRRRGEPEPVEHPVQDLSPASQIQQIQMTERDQVMGRLERFLAAVLADRQRRLSPSPR
jgi:tetratricopeptide (TPR) repeat protein